MKALLPILLVALATPGWTQGRSSTRDHYKKYEYMVPMRDGVKLYVQAYVPTDADKVTSKHPILMERTPYGAGPKGPDTYKGFRGSPKLQEAGYIFAFSDVRGKGFSEGDFVNTRPQLKPGQKGIDESTDTWDTVDFLVKNVPGNNGHVGLWGISYPGFYAGAGAINTHPALTAVSPQAPVSDWFLGDDVHHNGAFFTQDNFDFSTGFDVPRGKEGPRVDRQGKSAYDFFLSTGALPNFDKLHYKGLIPYWNEILQHETYDEYWKDRSLTRNFKNVKCAVLTVGGMFDAEDMWGALNLYQAGEKQNKGIPNFIAMGPWYHGMWAGPGGQKFGDLDFGMPTSKYFQDEIEFPFFEKYLRGVGTGVSEATIFETGVNTWHKFDAWPPKGLKPWSVFLSSDKSVARTAPATEGELSYENDPAAPTPYLEDWKNSRRRTREYMIDDQRFASERPDVLTYTSPVLDADQQALGPVEADLWVKTTGTDADFVVKIIDVWPDSTEGTARNGRPMAGYEQLVRGDIFRGKFRKSFERPIPFVPGEATEVKFPLNAMAHTFRKGHRIMIQIQSSWFPLVDRNPNQFEVIKQAKDEDFRKATITILSGGKHASGIHFKSL